MRRVSKPSLRRYVDVQHIPHVRRGLGIAVLSTPNGLLSDREAREQNVGGELVCEVWYDVANRKTTGVDPVRRDRDAGRTAASR